MRSFSICASSPSPRTLVGVEQLQPGLAAAGEPAERGPVRRGGAAGVREISTVSQVAARRGVPAAANVRTNVPRPRGSAKRVSWHTVLMPVPEVLSDVLEQPPRLRGRERLHLRQAQQHLLGDRLRRADRAPRPRPASRHRRGRRTGRRPASARGVRRPRRRRAAGGDAGRLARSIGGRGSAAASAIGASDSIAARTPSGRCAGLLAERRGGGRELVLDPRRRSRRARVRCRRW